MGSEEIKKSGTCMRTFIIGTYRQEGTSTALVLCIEITDQKWKYRPTYLF